MNLKRLTEFRRMLEELRQELSQSLQRRELIVVEEAADALDRHVGAASRETAVLHLQRASKKLRAVDAALDRLQAGDFGECLGCEEPIHPLRLHAVPWAELCLHCQEEADRKINERSVLDTRFRLGQAA